MKNSKILGVIVFILVALVFWGLRLHYWKTVSEPPWSDILDYVNIALKIIDEFRFSSSAFWQAYKPPGMPVAIAIIFYLFGKGNILAFQIFASCLTFSGICLLAIELKRLTGNWWVSLLFGISVSLSKSSIFWSLKLSTEYLSEGLIYLSLGIGLCSLRNKKLSLYFLWGSVSICSVLVRPQNILFFIFQLFFIFVFLYFKGENKPIDRVRNAASKVSVFLLAASLFWSPWVIRNYRIYNGFVPLSTQGPYSFLWEVGDINVKIKDELVSTNVHELQKQAPLNFENDYLAHNYAKQILIAWLKQDFYNYLDIVGRRLVNMIISNEIYLTKVSRINLFNSNIDRFLFDKSVALFIIGLIGLIYFCFYKIEFSIIAGAVILNWLFSAIFLGYPRLLEPILPIVNWAALAIVSILLFKLFRYFKRLIEKKVALLGG